MTSTATSESPTDDRRQGGEVTIASLEFLSLILTSRARSLTSPTIECSGRGSTRLDADNELDWEANGIAEVLRRSATTVVPT